MDDILTSIIGIGLAVVIMFIFPLMTISDITDDISQLTVEVATTEFVDDIRQIGKITPDMYHHFVESIGSTGNTYNVEIEVRVLDENASREKIYKSQGVAQQENVYYSIYTSQIVDNIIIGQDKNYYLKEGDIVTVSIKNTNQTISQQLKNFFYSVVGKGTYVIAASHGGMVTATGK